MRKEVARTDSQGAKLDDLFKSGETIEDRDLAAALRGRVFLVQGTDRVFLEPSFSTANITKKIIAVSLGRHVLRRKNLLGDSALAAPVEWYSEQIQEKPKTVAETLSRLKGRGVLDRTDTGYLVPTWALRRAINFLQPD